MRRDETRGMGGGHLPSHVRHPMKLAVTITLATFLMFVPQFVLFCICLTALNGSKVDFTIGSRTCYDRTWFNESIPNPDFGKESRVLRECVLPTHLLIYARNS